MNLEMTWGRLSLSETSSPMSPAPRPTGKNVCNATLSVVQVGASPEGGCDRLLGLDPEVDGNFHPGEDHCPQVVSGHGQVVPKGKEAKREGALEDHEGQLGIDLNHEGGEDDDEKRSRQRASLSDPSVAREPWELLARHQEGSGGFNVQVDDDPHDRVVASQPPQAPEDEALRDAGEGGFYVDEQQGRGQGPLHG